MELNHHKAKEAWKDVCAPKKERGLGILFAKDWNKLPWQSMYGDLLKLATRLVGLIR